jgi:hypothetical protein
LGLSATLFGLVLGTYDWATGERSHQIMAGVILQAPMAVLWGVFLGGLWLILWPLAYFTHFMIQWLDETQSGWSAS